jgi:uncharacterized iron-regulated membrane protein
VLTPDQLLGRFTAQSPDAKPTSITLRAKPGAAPQVTFMPKGATKTRKLYLDPYDGEILGFARGEAFFATVRQIHRYLLLPGDGKGVGRQITGAVLDLALFARQPLGEQIVSARLSVHRGTFLGLPGAILFMLAAGALPLFPITGYLLYLGRRKANKTAAMRKRREPPEAMAQLQL